MEFCPNCFEDGWKNSTCRKCGYKEIHYGKNAMVLLPGTVLASQYMIGRTLGAGGFGITYLARDQKSGKLCAIKEYFPSGLVVRKYNSATVCSNSKNTDSIVKHGLQVFVNEARILNGFTGSHSIVQVVNFFEQNNTAYLVMEYLRGLTLHAFTKSSGGKIDFELGVKITTDIAQTLRLVHQKGLLHRDVSPENIFLTADGAVKLIDFGATRCFVGEKSKNMSVVLKPGFAPPEQYSSKGNQGPWTDIYALAATFYKTVTGIPVPESVDRLNGDTLQALNRIMPGVDNHIAMAVSKALELNYKSRYQTVDEFLVDFGNRSGNTPSSNNGGMGSVQTAPYIKISSEGHKWQIPRNMDIIIGRSSEQSNIVINNPNISRVHCVVRYDERERAFRLMDHSSNGTFKANGERLSKSRVYTISPGERFFMYSKSFTVEVGLE